MKVLNYFYKHTVHFSKISILFICFAFTIIDAQNSNDITFEDESLKFGIKAATNGLGLFFRTTKPYKKNLSKALDIDFSSIRHPREKEIINTRLGNTRPYVFNKVNRIYNLRLLGGLHYLFAERNTKNSIGIAAFALIGPAITFIKPVYIDVQTIDPNNASNYIVVSRRYEPEKIQNSLIVGNSSYFTGIGNMRLGVGLSFKAGVEFNWGSYSSEFKSIEAGFILDYLASNPVIIHNEKNKQFFSGFYISFALGKNK